MGYFHMTHKSINFIKWLLSTGHDKHTRQIYIIKLFNILIFKLNIPNLKKENGFYYVKGSRYRFRIPKMNNDLALFIGLLYGDGWLISRKSAVKK